MEDNKVSVTLSSPAKIDGKREPAGKVVTVSAAVASHLHAAKAVASAPLIFDTSDTQTSADFDNEVALTAKMLAEGIVAHAVDAAITPLVAERDELVTKLDATTTLLTEANEKLFEAEAHLENATFDAERAEEKAIKNELAASAELDELRKRVPELEAALADATKASAAKTTKK